MILSAVLLGVAVGLLALRPATGQRLQALVPRPAPAPVGGTRLARGPVLVAVGIGLWWVLGGVPGLVLGAGVAGGGPPLLARLDARDDREDEELTLQLPLALELVGACLSGGSPLAHALTSVATALGGPAGLRLQRVGAALSVGTPTEEAFGELGDSGSAGAAARALRRAAEGGTPVAAAVSRVAEESRRRATAVARKRVRQAGVQAAAPLTLCFLPAFLVLGTVPCVVAVAGPLLQSL